MDIGPSEAETFWTAFPCKLARRGLRGVRLVVSDSNEGIEAAVSAALQRGHSSVMQRSDCPWQSSHGLAAHRCPC